MKIHLIGICGSGMSGIAILAAQAGHTVSGSDIRLPSSHMHDLFAKNQIIFFDSHAEANLNDVEIVVASVAIPKENIERQAAARRSLPVMSRMQFLNSLLSGHGNVISVIGSFGKSTVTSAIAEILLDSRVDPSVYAGCTIPAIHASSTYGHAQKVAVIETCEYAQELMHACPTLCLLTSIGVNHEDQFGSSTAPTYELFQRFFDKNTAALKRIVIPGSLKSGFKNAENFITFGEAGDDWFSIPVEHTVNGMQFDVYQHGTFYGRMHARLLGETNMKNLTGVIALLDAYGLDKSRLQSALLTIKPVSRRFEIKKNGTRLAYIDDNARLPDQICATVSAAKSVFQECHVIVALGIWGKKNARDISAVCASLHGVDHVMIAPSAEFELDAGGAERLNADQTLKSLLIEHGLSASIDNSSIDTKLMSALSKKKIVLLYCGYDNMTAFGLNCLSHIESFLGTDY